MEISYNLLIVLFILECCLCCRRSWQRAKPEEIAKGRKKIILNVEVTSRSRNERNCNVGKGDSFTGQADSQMYEPTSIDEVSEYTGIFMSNITEPGADDINLCFDENEEVEIICTGDNLPSDNYLIWHQHTAGNVIFSTEPLTQESDTYSLKLHMDRIDNGSYVYCTLRYENKDVAVSKNINLLLNSASALPGFGNFIPDYYDDTDVIKRLQCQEGYAIYRDSSTGIPKMYNGGNFNISLDKSDDGTVAACGYFINKPCDSSSLKCEVERIIENKHIYLYKQYINVTDENYSSFLITIIGAGVAIIIISIIMALTLLWWRNKHNTNTRAEDSSYVTNESLLYVELQLTESNPSQRRMQDDSTPYATVTGVLAP